jgi:hypothetical protein
MPIRAKFPARDRAIFAASRQCSSYGDALVVPEAAPTQGRTMSGGLQPCPSGDAVALVDGATANHYGAGSGFGVPCAQVHVRAHIV